MPELTPEPDSTGGESQKKSLKLLKRFFVPFYSDPTRRISL
jgi:hypothetical protein